MRRPHRARLFGALPVPPGRPRQREQQRGACEQRPPHRAVPFQPSGFAQHRIDARVLHRVVGHGRRLAVEHPAVFEAVALRVVTPHPGRVETQYVQHAVEHGLPFGAVVHRLHAFEQAVEFGTFVIRCVLALCLHLALRAVQQEQEVFRIRVVGVPAPEEQLRSTLAYLFLEAVVVGAAHHQLHAEPVELLGQPVDARLAAQSGAGGVEIDHQRFAGLFASRPFGQPASASSRFASSIGLRFGCPSTQSYMLAFMPSRPSR
jgi:hypothetical protein